MNYLFYSKSLIYPDRECGYSPSKMYPEYPFRNDVKSKSNLVYDSIREMFYDMGLDSNHYGTSSWNPLGEWIKPSMNVCLKPNFVMHQNGSENPDDLDSLVTHPSIIRCILDYCYIALNGKGTVIVGDAPVKDCNFKLLMENRGYIDIVKYYNNLNNNFKVLFCDFRGPVEEGGQYYNIGEGILVNLKDKSWFFDNKNCEDKYRIPNYDYRNVISHHSGFTQEYLINSSILNADVIISIPKPKTHRKNGYTAALKNFIGVNYSKEYLPHHTEGSLLSGGDEYIYGTPLRKMISLSRKYIDINRVLMNKNSSKKKVYNFLRAQMWKIYSRLMRLDSWWIKKNNYSLAEAAQEGAWYGNDTLWRTVLDINYAILYASCRGDIQEVPQRKILHFGDMIISGEKEGPMSPSSKQQHMLLLSDNAVEFDCIVTKIMGFDYNKFKTLEYALKSLSLIKNSYEEIYLTSNIKNCKGLLKDLDIQSIERPFIASKGWRGHIEL